MYAPGVLWTAAHHRIPLLSVMHNNRAYHQEVMHIQRMANRHQRGAISHVQRREAEVAKDAQVLPVRRRQIIDVSHAAREKVVDLVGHAQQCQHIDGNNRNRGALTVFGVSGRVVDNGSEHSDGHSVGSKARVKDKLRGMEIVIKDQPQDA